MNRTRTPSPSSPSSPFPPAPAARPAPVVLERLALPLLWLPVPAVVAMAHFLIQGDLALGAGVADLDPLYGLTELFIGAAAVVIGVVSLVLAIIASVGSGGSRAGICLGSAAWTAACGLVFVAFMAWASETDPVLVTSTTAGAQHGWQAAAAFVVTVPLGLVLLARLLARPLDRTLDH